MQPDPTNDTSDPVTPTDLARPKPRGRALLRISAAAGFIGCAVLGLLLFQAEEREQALQAELARCQNELSSEQTTRRRVEAERDDAARSLTSVRGVLSECQDSLAESQDSLESAVRLARSHRDKLDEIASAIRIGMIGVADIPDEGFVFSGGYDLDSEYRAIVKKYNDLVERFSAAIERSNGLGEIVNQVVIILRS